MTFCETVSISGFGFTKVEYRYAPDCDFLLKLSKHVQQAVKPILKFYILELKGNSNIFFYMLNDKIL